MSPSALLILSAFFILRMQNEIKLTLTPVQSQTAADALTSLEKMVNDLRILTATEKMSRVKPAA